MSVTTSMGADVSLAISMPRQQAERLSARRLNSLSDPFFSAFPESGCFQQERFMAALFATIAPSESAEPVLIGVESSQGDPVAWFAFLLRRQLGARVLEGLDLNVTDYFAPPLAPDLDIDADAVWQAVLGSLPPVDAITFKKVPQVLHGRRHALTGSKTLRPMGAFAHSVSLLEQDGTAKDISKLSVTRDVRRKAKKLAAAGKVSFSQARTRDEIEEALSTLFAFRLERFAALGRPDPLASPHYRRFYHALAEGDEPLARLFTLRVDETPVASIYCLTRDGVLTLIIPAMSSDPAWTPASPGLIALYRTLEWAQEAGYRVFDLSVGSLEYKTRFAAAPMELYEQAILMRPRGALVVLDAELRRLARQASKERKWLRGLIGLLQRHGL